MWRGGVVPLFGCIRRVLSAWGLSSEILRLGYPQSVRAAETALQQQQFALNRRNKAYMCREEARLERRETAAKKLALYVVIGPAATGANRKAGNYRRRTDREIFVVFLVSNFLCSRPEPQSFSYKSAV